MNKEQFIGIIDALQNQYDYDVKRTKDLRIFFGDDVMMPDNSVLVNQLFKIIHESFPMPDNGICPVVEFCYGENFGKLSGESKYTLWEKLLYDIDVEVDLNFEFKEDPITGIIYESKNIVDNLNEKILVAKKHGAKYEVQRLQQLLDTQLEKNKKS